MRRVEIIEQKLFPLGCPDYAVVGVGGGGRCIGGGGGKDDRRGGVDE